MLNDATVMFHLPYMSHGPQLVHFSCCKLPPVSFTKAKSRAFTHEDKKHKRRKEVVGVRTWELKWFQTFCFITSRFNGIMAAWRSCYCSCHHVFASRVSAESQITPKSNKYELRKQKCDQTFRYHVSYKQLLNTFIKHDVMSFASNTTM